MGGNGTETHPRTAAVGTTAAATAPADTGAWPGGDPDPAGDPPAAVTPELAFEMQATTNVRYHEDRQAFFASAGRWSNFLVLVLGSGAAALATAGSPALTSVTALLAAVCGAAQLVFDFGGKAGTHGELRRSFLRLIGEASRPHADVGALNAEMIRLLESEPEIYHAVTALAYNATQLAYGRRADTLLVVTPFERRMRHLRHFDPVRFQDVTPSGDEQRRPAGPR